MEHARFRAGSRAGRPPCAGIVLRAFLDPVVEEFVGLRAASETQSSFVRHLAQRFAKIRLVSAAIGVIRRPPDSWDEGHKILIGKISAKAELQNHLYRSVFRGRPPCCTKPG